MYCWFSFFVLVVDGACLRGECFCCDALFDNALLCLGWVLGFGLVGIELVTILIYCLVYDRFDGCGVSV